MESGSVVIVNISPWTMQMYSNILKATMLLLNTPALFVMLCYLPKMPLLSTNRENTSKGFFPPAGSHFTLTMLGSWQCNYCDYQSKIKCNMQQHIESHHVAVQYQCSLCDTVCPSKNALAKHKARKHVWSYFTFKLNKSIFRCPA